MKLLKLLFPLLTLITLGVAVYSLPKIMESYKAASRLQSVPANVVAFRAQEQWFDPMCGDVPCQRRLGLQVQVQAEYQWQGKALTTERFSYVEGNDLKRSEMALGVARQLRPGAVTRVWVDPESPQVAVLVNDFSLSEQAHAAFVFSIAALLFGLGSIALWRKSEPNHSLKADGADAPRL